MVDSRGWKNVIYSSYDQLPDLVGTYDNNRWVDKQLYRISSFKNELPALRKRNSFLIECVNSFAKNNVTVVDFGGGLGLSYLTLKEFTDKNLNYHIVEVPGICRIGLEKFNEDSSLSFSEHIRINFSKVDVVYIRTALQYAKDWKKCIRDLLALRPDYFLLSHLSAGNIETYLTLQLWADQEIPYWFLNINEVEDIFLNEGYECFLEDTCYDLKQDSGWKTYRFFADEYRIESLLKVGFKKIK